MKKISEKLRLLSIQVLLIAFVLGLPDTSFGQAALVAEEELIQSFDNKIAFDLLFMSDNPSIDSELMKRRKLAFYQLLQGVKNKSKYKYFVYSLYDAIHNNYFVQYEEQVKFSEIFQSGNYNCLTGTAMYAMALDYLEIPYKILEQPTHVYLVVFHETGNYIIEATRPATSAIKINKKYIKWYKKQLVLNKLASQYEVNQIGFVTSRIYDGEEISLKELVGSQYSNNAIYYSQSGDRRGTLTQAEKAYMLKPDPKILNMIIVAAFGLLDQPNISDEESCQLFHTLSSYRVSSAKPNETLKKYIGRALYLNYKENKDPDNLESYMNCIAEGLKDSFLINDIQSIGNRLITAHYLDQGNLEEAKIYLEKCNAIDTSINFELAKQLFFLTAATISYEKPEEILETLSYYEERYSEFHSDRELLKIKSNLLLYAASLNFENDDLKKGEFYLNEFENKFPNSDPSLYVPNLIGSAYGSYSAYYVRALNHKKAKEILIRGLKYDSENVHLLRKKGYLDEE